MWLHLSGQELEFYLHLSVWHTLWYKCSKAQHDPRMTKLSPWAIRTPTLCEFWVTVKETQIKRPSFFGGKLTRGWWLLKGCYHSEIRRPGWDLLIHVPGSRRRGPLGAVHTHERCSDKFSVICTPFLKGSAANITGRDRRKPALSPP